MVSGLKLLKYKWNVQSYNDLSTSLPLMKLLPNLNYSFKRLGARTAHTVFVLGVMEKMWVGQQQGEQVVGPIVRKDLWTLASAAFFLRPLQAQRVSISSQCSSWPSHTRVLFPLPELGSCASLLGSFLRILDLHIKCQFSRDTFLNCFLF